MILKSLGIAFVELNVIIRLILRMLVMIMTFMYIMRGINIVRAWLLL